jgi:hypothetical protein
MRNIDLFFVMICLPFLTSLAEVQGKVWEIPRANFSGKGTTFRFTDIPCYDSPILITNRSNIVLRRQGGL